MKGAELILRYFALRHDRNNYSKPLSSFLDQFSGAHRQISEEKANEWAQDFKRAVDRVHFAFGKLAFRIFEKNLSSSSAFNSALYDAQMISFAETSNAKIVGGKYSPERLQREAYRLFENERFLNSIRQATSDETSVKTRIDAYTAFLNGF
jgi:hypothetical protein